jgi:hypothetical protein
MNTPHIKETWKSHPLFESGKIELIPTDVIARFRGVDVSEKTTLKDGTEVDMDALWENILAEGLHDPVIIRVGIQNKMMRLEAGNHRIQLYQQHHIPFIPTTVQLRDECGPHVSDTMNDGSHNFDASGDLLLDSIPEEYVRPSEALRGMTLSHQ